MILEEKKFGGRVYSQKKFNSCVQNPNKIQREKRERKINLGFLVMNSCFLKVVQHGYNLNRPNKKIKIKI